MFIRLICIKKSKYLSTQINARKETSQHVHPYNEPHVTLLSLSDANIPVCFRVHQQAKYSALQLTAVCILNVIENTNHGGHIFSRHRRFNFPCWPRATFSLPSKFMGGRERPVFSTHKSTLMTKTELTIPAFLFKICGFRSSILLSL